MVNPFRLWDGAVEYSIGKFDGRTVIYDFPKILIYLNAKGKLLFGKQFKIYEEDQDILLKLCHYYIRDFENCKKHGIDPDKGLLLSGPVGCGKTSLMKLLRHIVPHQRPYQIIPSRNVVFAFNHIGYRTIEDYGNGQFFCFDDLGVEPMGRHFGKDCNVLGEILLSRHELFQKRGDRKSTRLNSSHRCISYAVFCLKKKIQPTAHRCDSMRLTCIDLP